MNDVWEGFSERSKKLAPLWMFAQGMRINGLNEYLPNILLAMMLEIFQRELDDDERRTRTDIDFIAREVLRVMKLEANDAQVERLVYGLLFSGDKEMQKPFESIFFDEIKNEFQNFTFRYLEDDRLASRWSTGGDTVYKLTEMAQEIVFMSREISEEFNITVEQLYTLQLIKNKNFKKAQGSFRNLIGRVKQLLINEEELQIEMKQNPKIIIQEAFEKRKEREAEVKGQFDEEKKRFSEIHRTLSKIKDTTNMEEAENEIEELLLVVERTRQLHDRLASLVIENYALEIELRTKHPEIFWSKSQHSLKEDIWEKLFLQQAEPHLDALEGILNGFFSPKNEFILPLDWIWQEQEMPVEEELIIVEHEVEEEMEMKPIVTDWDAVSELWEGVFNQLLSYGEFNILELESLPIEEQEKWFVQKEAFELWMLFASQPIKYGANALTDDLDERNILLQRLIERDEKYRELLNQSIYAEKIEGKTEMAWETVRITPCRLVLT